MRRAAMFMVAVVAFAACAAAASGASPYTNMYVGNKLVAYFDPEFGQEWNEGDQFSCYEGGYAIVNRQHTRMVFQGPQGVRYGYARRVKPGQWAVYSYGKLVGSTMQQSSLRWDVFRGNRLVGHTRGPDGREASAALLVYCLS